MTDNTTDSPTAQTERGNASRFMAARVSRRAALSAAAGTIFLAACGGSKKNQQATQTGTTAATSAAVTPSLGSDRPATPFVATPFAPTPVASPTETPDDSGIAKLVIPKAGIDAGFVTIGVIAATNTMDSPKNKDDVGYYDFTPQPTYGGNTVLSGHVDWYTGETGVFWNLKNLTKGDDLQMVMGDDRVLHYTITETELYDADTAPVEQIIGATPVESVTLITCEGVFNRSSAEYNKRRVVRAERVYP